MDKSKLQYINKAFILVGDLPLDYRTIARDKEEIKNIDFMLLYPGIKVFNIHTGEEYVWKEWDEATEEGLLDNGFVYPANHKIDGVDYGYKKFNFVKFPGGSPVKLVGNATVFDDIYTNLITVNEGLPLKTLSSKTINLVRPYWIEYIDGGNAKIWTKVSLPPGGSKTITLSINGTYPQNPSDVFEYFDDFESGLIGWSQSGSEGWDITTNEVYSGTYSAVNRDISDSMSAGMYKNLYSGYKTKLSFYWKVSSERNYDFLEFLANNVLIDKISGGKDWAKKEVTLEAGTNKIEFKYVKDSSVSGRDDSGYVDLLIQRKFTQNEPTVTATTNDHQTWTVTVTNNESFALDDYQIPIIIDSTNTEYSITEEVIIPDILTTYFPGDIDSNVKFVVQIPHRVRLGSTLRFHMHLYPDTDITENKTLDMTFSFAKFATNGLPEQHTINKIFTITPEMIGRHIIFNFGEVTIVDTISQILICSLTRNATQDTYGDIPILFTDFHYEIDTMGSNSEFIK